MGAGTDSFFRRARLASVGPLLCILMASMRSTMPLESSISYCSLVRTSICTVTDEYGFCLRTGQDEAECAIIWEWAYCKRTVLQLRAPIALTEEWNMLTTWVR